MSSSFNIAFRGELIEGFDTEQVRSQVAQRFRLPAAGVDKVFAGRRVVLKRGLDAAQADAYVRELAELGLRVVAETEKSASTPGGGPAPAAPGQGDASAFRILYCGGIAPGCLRDEVIATARRRLKLGEAQLDQVFSGREMTLKAGLDEAGARRYLAVLGEIGMDARSDPALSLELPPAEAADDIERRLMEAMNAEFDLPSTLGGNFAHKAPKPPTDTDLAMASHQMVETVLNADAMQMYDRASEPADTGPVIDAAEEARFARELAAQRRAVPETPSVVPVAAEQASPAAVSAAAARAAVPATRPTAAAQPPVRSALAPEPPVSPPKAPERARAAPAPHHDVEDSSGHALARTLHGMVLALFGALLVVLLWVVFG